MNPKILNQIRSWQQANQKVVLSTGVFDVLHIEHFRFFQKAQAAGDKLIVGLESDARVKAIKGDLRPINPQAIRLEQLQAIIYIDLAFVLPEHFSNQTDWEQFMADLKPDIYAVSSHSQHLENKQRICEKFGIQFKIVHDFNPNHSSTKVIKQLKQTP